MIHRKTVETASVSISTSPWTLNEGMNFAFFFSFLFRIIRSVALRLFATVHVFKFRINIILRQVTVVLSGWFRWVAEISRVEGLEMGDSRVLCELQILSYTRKTIEKKLKAN